MISIITPFHKSHEKYLPEAYACLTGQTIKQWEWILIPNNGAKVPASIEAIGDRRLKIIEAFGTSGIGGLKRMACEAARGDIIVEYDADDLLMPEALNAITAAFKKKQIVFVYSNSANFEDGTWKTDRYSSDYGWRWRDFEFQDHRLDEMIAWPPSAHMMRYIYWAPNHVRAWRRAAYEEIGGHDRTLLAGDDHDLCCRFYVRYGAKGFRHVDECLYLYRRHQDNSFVRFNAEIQKQTDLNYCKYSRDLATRWAKDEGLVLLDLGGRFNAWPGYQSVDCNQPADIVCDLNEPWPWEDSTVGVIKAYHIFEHLRDPIYTMNEAYRVLAPGGWFFIEVPSSEGRGAFQDPTHLSFWNENSIWYYTKAQYAAFIKPRMQCRFQKSRIVTYFPDEFHREHNIPIVQADLIALKPPYDERPPGEIVI